MTHPKAKPRPAQKREGTPTNAKAKLSNKDKGARLEAFCLAYHVNPVGKDAAVKAGYSKSSAEAAASRLLRIDKVKERLQELAALQESRAIADGKERRELLTRILRNEVKDIATGGKELEFIETPVPVSERTKAIVELAKMDGDYAAVKVDVKITEYSRDWLKQALQVVSKYVSPDDLRKIAAEIPRFDP